VPQLICTDPLHLVSVFSSHTLSKFRESVHIALEAGADAFVVKGEPPQQLVAAIREIYPPQNQVQDKGEQQ